MGMIIYEMLALNIPYYDQNPFQVPMLIMKGVRPALPEKVTEAAMVIQRY